ncbi:MAG: site-specific integrase [Acidobacteria bacterium]|nr:site-specific integrase [Acidobacteriota bacterium]
MKRGTRGMGRVYQRGGVWWIAYYHDGRKHRESSGSSRRPDAVALLKRRHEELGKGRPVREAEKVLLTDLRALIDADYQLNNRRSGRRIDLSWSHLTAFFGEKEKAVTITAPRLAAYVTTRNEEGAASATIRNELAAFKRAFTLARKSGTLLPNEVPAAFPTVRATNARAGFFERDEHEAVRAALPPDEGDVAEFLFWSGWRKGEALGLQWRNVDEAAGVIRIEHTKSGEPRTLPYGALPALEALIAHRRELTDAVQKARGMVVSHVFHRNGEPIVTFYRSWAKACVSAGLGQDVRDAEGRLLRRTVARIPHDYRRSAARNLSRAGVPERVIMQLCGWKTRSVFDRYRIVAERDLAEGLAKLAEAPPAAATARVERLKKAGPR